MGVSLRVSSWGHCQHGSSIYITSTYILHHTSITSYCITPITSYCITHYIICITHITSYCITPIASYSITTTCTALHLIVSQYMAIHDSRGGGLLSGRVGRGVMHFEGTTLQAARALPLLEQLAHRSVKSSPLQVPQTHRAISCTRS